MNSISIRWDRRAVKELTVIPKELHQKVFDAVDSLRDDPLKGRILSGRWKGFRRLRVGDYRIVYVFDGVDSLISVLRIAHRKEVYR